MHKRFVLIPLALASLTFAGPANADPLKSKMTVPLSYKDVQFGIQEVRDNLDTVSCGGWTDPTPVKMSLLPPPDTGPCNMQLDCHDAATACSGGFTGFVKPKQPDGTIPICISRDTGASGIAEMNYLHELTHVKQACKLAPGVPFHVTQADCCQLEGEAYSVECNFAAASGMFNVPYNGIMIDVPTCVLWGMNKGSCASFGPNACGDDSLIPPGYSAAMLAAFAAVQPTFSCAQIQNSPTPAMKAATDEIQKMSLANQKQLPTVSCASGGTDCVPVPNLGKDLPGRTNVDPLGDPKTGIGKRGAFEFPDTTFGYLSSCNIKMDRYQDPDLQKLHMDIVLEDQDDPDAPVKVKVQAGDGQVDVNPGHWCIRYDKATPKWCKKLYEEAWPALSAAAHGLISGANMFCPPPPADALYAPTYVDKHFCFDRAPAVSDTRICHGQECRTPQDPAFYNVLAKCSWQAVYDADGNYIGQKPVDNSPDLPLTYGFEDGVSSSYYRHYAQDYRVPGVTVTTPGKTWQVRGECYEYYKEDDPQVRVTAGDGGGKDNDEQCELVIATPDEQNPDPPEWVESGGHSQKENVPDPNPGKNDDPTRDPRTAPDPWKIDAETNLSIIDVKKLQELQKGFEDPADITGVVGAIIPAKQIGSKTVPDNARTDAYDDSDHRALGKYWEAQEKILVQLVRDPITRLVMPGRFLVGLDEKSPLYQYVRGVVSKSDGTVELTLKAGREDLGNVLEALKQTYVLPITEVKIPVIIPQAVPNEADPLASEDRIDQLILQWQQWKEYEKRDAAGPPARASFDGDADPLIAKLKNYKAKIVQARKLRNALTKLIVRFYDPLREFDTKLATWYKDNTEALKLAAEKAKERQQLKRIWRHIQNSMLQTDACQLQWCSNMRYSIAVYSLLDNWWGDAPKRTSRNPGYVPQGDLKTIAYVQPPDQVYDFSSLDFPRGEFEIPVLWEIQIPVNLPIPPMIGTKPQDPGDFPDLPNLPDAAVFDAFPIPQVNVPTLEKVQPPPPTDLSGAKDILRKFRVMIDGTSVADQQNEESFEDTTGVVTDEGPNFPKDRESMRGAYCRFIPSITIPPDPIQKTGNPEKIIHVENDLRERAARLFSRWLPERTEDLAGRFVRVKHEYPSDDVQPKCKEDIVCAFLPPVKTTTIKQQVFFPTAVPDFSSFADDLKSQSLPDAANHNPYLRSPIDLLKRFFPALDLPITIDLSPS